MSRPYIQLTLLLAVFCLFSCTQKATKDRNKLTAINPLSYTSVIYSSDKDTVFVSTYSGRIARRINMDSSEHVIATIDDEIYALAYNKKRNEIIAATLHSGVLVINAQSGKTKKKLSINETWAIRLAFTKDGRYLYTADLKGKNHIWDADNDYKEMPLPEIVSAKTIRLADAAGKFYFSGNGEGFVWDISSEQIENKLATKGNRFADIDKDGNILLLNHHECSFYNRSTDSVRFTVSHPNWIYLKPDGEVLAEIPLSMQLTKARFANHKIYTSGIDRSIRVWNKTDGALLDNLIGHKATISDIDVSKNNQQLVSVDLKGGIRFWDLK